MQLPPCCGDAGSQVASSPAIETCRTAAKQELVTTANMKIRGRWTKQGPFFLKISKSLESTKKVLGKYWKSTGKEQGK